MSWTQVKSAFCSVVSAVQVNHPSRLRSLYLHSDAPGSLYFYDASAAVSTTGPLRVRFEMPHRATVGNPDTVTVYIPDAGIRFEQAMFVRVSGAANCGITLFYD